MEHKYRKGVVKDDRTDERNYIKRTDLQTDGRRTKYPNKEWKVVGSEMPVGDELTNAERFKSEECTCW